MIIEKIDHEKIIEPCLGILNQGPCSDFFNYQYSVYNLGIAIGAISIIIVVWQTVKPLYEIRINYRKGWFKIAFILFVLNILFAAVGAVAPYLLGNYIPIISHPIFWEILAALCFITSLGILFYITLVSIKRVNTIKKLERIYQISISVLDKGEVYRGAFSNELQFFIQNLVKLAAYKDMDLAQIPNEILDILAERDFCKLIATKNKDTLKQVILSYAKPTYVLNPWLIRDFLNEIIHASLDDSSSFISRELNREGTGKDRIILNLIEKHFDFFGKNDELFQTASAFGRSPIYFQNFPKFLDFYVGLYFSRVENLIDAKYIGRALSYLNSAMKFNKPINLDINWFNVIRSKETLIKWSVEPPEIKFEKDGNYIPRNDKSIFGVIAMNLFSLMETSSPDLNYEREYYRGCCNILDLEKEGKFWAAVKKRLDILIIQRVKENIKAYYSSILRPFFHIYGYSIFIEKQAGELEMKVLKELASGLPKLCKGLIWNYTDIADSDVEECLKVAKKTLSELFPAYMSYENERGLLIYHGFFPSDNKILDLKKSSEQGKLVFI